MSLKLVRDNRPLFQVVIDRDKVFYTRQNDAWEAINHIAAIQEPDRDYTWCDEVQGDDYAEATMDVGDGGYQYKAFRIAEI